MPSSLNAYDTDYKRLSETALCFAIFHKLKGLLHNLQSLAPRFFPTNKKEVDCVCRKSNLQPVYKLFCFCSVARCKGEPANRQIFNFVQTLVRDHKQIW
jgi:hypothetical protein